MAQDDCVGTWTKVKLGTDPDEDFEIKLVGSTLIGTCADGTTLQNLSCDGKDISFFRVTPSGETISYMQGKITKASPTLFKLKGKFHKTPKVTPARSKSSGKKKALAQPDDWTAEKPT